MHAVSLEKRTGSLNRKKTKPILVLGVGNILHRDDGVGVHIINILKREKRIAPFAEVVDGGTAGFDLLSVMRERKKIIIVDALKADDVPGSIYRIPAFNLKDRDSKMSLHEAGVKQIVDMLHVTGEDPEVEILGVVAEDISSVEIGLSEKVESAVPRAIEEIIKIITE